MPTVGGGGGGILAVNDSAATLEGNSVQVNVLANDDVEGGGTGNCMSFGTIVSVSTPGNGSATVGADVITYAPNGVGTDSFTYTIQDPVTQEQSTATVYVTTYADPYPAYLTAVGAANQAYQSAMVASAASAQAMVDNAAAAAAAQAAAAYTQYTSAFDAATDIYSATIASAESDYADAEANADATRDAANTAAMSTLVAAFDDSDTADGDWGEAFDAYTSDADAAFSAYTSAMAPYETALTSALEAFEADPTNSTVAQALDDAIAALEAAGETAGDALETSLAAAADSYAPSETAALAANDDLNAAIDAYVAALSSADDAWSTTMQAAYSQYLSAKASADGAFVAAEVAAWSEYSGTLAGINATLADDASTAQVTFDSQSTANAAIWAENEQTAWTSYQTALNAIPVAVPQGDRIGGPADAGVGPPAAPGNVAAGERQEVAQAAQLPAPIQQAPLLDPQLSAQLRALQDQRGALMQAARSCAQDGFEYRQGIRVTTEQITINAAIVATLKRTNPEATASIQALQQLDATLRQQREFYISLALSLDASCRSHLAAADVIRGQMLDLLAP